MAEQQGAQQGGGHSYTDEDVELLLNETAKRAAVEAIKSTGGRNRRSREEEPPDEESLGMSSKLVKQLQTTVSVFNTLKEFSSNPLQKAIESKVGDLAAGVIEQAFSRPSGPPPKRDLIDTFLNSQLAFGLGQGLGSRAPELVESMGRTFGRDKAEQMIDGVISKYGSSPGGRSEQSRHEESQLPQSAASTPPESDSGKQSERELLLSLDPNNPEHVSAYAGTMGGISVDVARKMLMIHQDEFIKQMKTQGADTDQISKVRGSRIDKSPSQSVQEPHSQSIQEDNTIPETNVSSQRSGHMHEQQPEDIQDRQSEHMSPGQSGYIDFQDVPSPEPPSVHPPSAKHYDESPPAGRPVQNQQQIQPEVLKQFSDDIGKIMGDVVGKIESMSNTIFVLQNELDEIKSTRAQSSYGQSPEPAIQKAENVQDVESLRNVPKENIDTLKGRANTPKSSSEFFEEGYVQDVSDFERELQQEAAVGAKRLEEVAQKKQMSEKSVLSEQPISGQPSSDILVPPSPMIKPGQSDIVMQGQPSGEKSRDISGDNVQNNDIGGIQDSDIDNVQTSDIGNVQTSDIDNVQTNDIGGIQNSDIGSVQNSDIGKGIKSEDRDNKPKEKKYVRPIKKADIYKNIVAPSFKQDKKEKRS